MRVLHIITRLIVGGAQENTIASVLGLRDRHGVDARLLSGPTTGPEGTLEPLFDQRPGVLTVVPDLVRPVSPWQDWRALGHLAKHIRWHKPDIVHTHSGKAGFLGRLAAKRAGVPVIIHTVHGPSFGRFQSTRENWLYRTAEKIAARRTHHFVTVANAMTEQYLAAGIGRREQYTRVFSGFPLEPYLQTGNSPAMREKLGLRPDDFVVGKIARLFELKGHDDLFAVAPEIVARCPRVVFLLVGDGPWRERFEERAQKLRLDEHFIFTGLVPPKDVPGYVGVMNALVHLSAREGLPRALPQALAAGKPVVAYDCDGAREVCLDNETGFLVPPGDLATLSRRVLQLASGPELCERLGRRGQVLVKECFPVERMVDELFALYNRLLKA
jgi:glycosyltransferase involved in cell wall biosynthesis